MDDYAIATAAAMKVIVADESKYVPVWAQHQIPAGVPEQLASEVARAVVDALNAAHAGPSAEGQS